MVGSATGLTAARMLEIEAASIVDGEVVGDNLILTRHDGTDIDAGNVRGATGPSAANPVPWSNSTTYNSGAIVGYSGSLWKCKATNLNHPPHLFANEWEPIEGFDYSALWSVKDPYFISNDPTIGWEFFWKTGTSAVSLTSVVGEFETGDQALKVELDASSSQTMFMKEENIVRGGEIVQVFVRAKLRTASSGLPVLNVGMYQNDAAGPPAPFGSGVSVVGSNEGGQNLTTAWKTFMFTLTAVGGKSRAVPYINLSTGGGGNADVLLDRVEISRNKLLSLDVVNLPVGSTIAWPGSTIPSGFLLCDGQAVARADYPELFDFLGIRYGAGNGTTTFNLPNTKGKFLVGQDITQTEFDILGETGGSKTHQHVVPVSGGISGTADAVGSHDHGLGAATTAGVPSGTGGGQRVQGGNTSLAGGHGHGLSGSFSGSGISDSRNHLPPYMVFNYIIRAIPSIGIDTSTSQYFKGSATDNANVAYSANANMDFAIKNDPSFAWDATNKHWVCPQPGRYRIYVAYKANAASAGRTMRIFKNGAPVAAGLAETSAGMLGGFMADVLTLVPGDTISVQPTAAFTTPADGVGVENTYLVIQNAGLEGMTGGGSGGTDGWELEQSFSIATATWLFTHGHGTKGVSVYTEDSTGKVIQGDVSYPSVDQVRVDFYNPQTGLMRVWR